MRGAPAKEIQELAGPAHLLTTLRYMHLSPAARASAIELLKARALEDEIVGDMLEKGLRCSREGLTFRILA
jgi:hypothetical protein